MADFDTSSHVFRHIKKSWTDGEFVDPAAFRLRNKDGVWEEGLSVNWVEYFQTGSPREAVNPLRGILEQKGRTVSPQSRFALLNVGEVIVAAAAYVEAAVVLDPEPDDPSHALVKGYAGFNEEVAEEISKVVMGTYPTRN